MKSEGKSDLLAQKICASLVAAEDKLPGLNTLRKHLAEHPEAAPLVWDAFGIRALFLNEITKSYLNIETSSISSVAKTTFPVVDVMISLCPVKEFRESCVSAQLPLFLYPILNSSSKEEGIERAKAKVLCFINILVDEKTPDASHSLELFKTTELVPLCLRNMELGTEKTKIAAGRVLYAIFSNRDGLEYSCQTYDRFMAISIILNSVLVQMETMRSPELLEGVIKIYTKLCGMPNAKVVFNKNRPQMLYTEHIREMVRTNAQVKAAYEEFIHALQG
ncbi:CCR4-NOT transcription complex subunit 9 [Nematocida displodere]|uniref:CCR4-NOT transcription complex subunit 9 n=1 Tax=Nematocida displodere TaxID=1805483 RepID=A0A177ECZ6_9MICR|nr:CCR4-NOT transcription complex subunit 9 [Nematocida displodere]